MDVSPAKRIYLQKRSNLTSILAVTMIVGSNLWVISDPQSVFVNIASLVVGLGGMSVFVWCCCDLAMSKGYPWQVGLVGLASCIGYLIVYFLPDRWLVEKHRRSAAKVEDSNYLRDPNRL